MRYVEFLDIDVPGAGALGQIEFDPFLAAVASLRDTAGQHLVTTWIDPNPSLSIVEDGKFKLRDAASSVIMGTVPGADLLQKTTALNGQPTFEASTPSTIFPNSSTYPDSYVNAEEFTMLAVHNLTPAASTRYELFGIGGGNVGTDNLFPGLEVYSNATAGDSFLTLREGGTTTRRIIGAAPGIMGTTAISMVTFSVDKGLTLWWNKDQIEAEPSDTRPLTTPTFSYLGNRGAANPALGQFGMAMILRADLSKSEYLGARNIILDGLMKKYAIA